MYLFQCFLKWLVHTNCNVFRVLFFFIMFITIIVFTRYDLSRKEAELSLVTKLKRLEVKQGRMRAELTSLRASAAKSRLFLGLAPPYPILAFRSLPTMPALDVVASEPQCRMFSCFDHSRCSLTSGFPVYLYDPDVYVPLAGAEVDGFIKTTLRRALGYNPHLTRDPNEACIYLVIVGEAFPVDKSNLSTTESYKSFLNESALNTLPYWGGDGRNHVLLNLARRELSIGSGEAFREASTARAMFAQSTFTHQQFRPGFDIVTTPALGPPAGDVWAECEPIAPARRKYLLSFQGSQPPMSGVNGARDIFLMDQLRAMVAAAPPADRFLLQFDCDPPMEWRMQLLVGDWVLCGTDRSRRKVLRDSTFALLLAPGDATFASTALLQARLYEALRSGAIPVLLGGDRIRLPFAEVLDWRRAVLALPTARAHELHFLLRTFGDADLLALRRQGRALWERYLGSVQASVDSLLAVLRTRLLIPPRPAAYAAALPVFKNSYAPPQSESMKVESRERLGPLEVPYASPAYRRNYSVGLLHGYEAWNQWGDPFALFPQLPWDPVVTSEARFIGSAGGFRPLHMDATGRKFRKDLGGDRPREQFTVVILTYEREDLLFTALSRLHNLPYLNKVVVVWNGQSSPGLVTSWPKISAPVAVVRAARNSLNNRFLPYHLIDTEAVFCMDDDTIITLEEIVFAFRVWREHRDRIVGVCPRYHSWDFKKKDGFIYNSKPICELSMVLTGAAFVHRYYLWAYWRALPAAVRDYVDEYMNCEDIAMNFLVAHITRKPPIKVSPRWTFGVSDNGSLSNKHDHYGERNKCMKFFSRVMGYTPLMTTQYRAVSVLYKTNYVMKTCFNNV